MITLENLSIGYGRHRHTVVVADGLCACCQRGTLTCLLGRNGTGKSTLLRTIARFQAPLAGRVEVMGADAASYTPQEYARLVSVVLTTRQQGQNITVAELVALERTPYTGFWGTLSVADRNIVDEAMQLVGISDLATRRAATLSDGERQKAMVAKALAQQTPILLLDEPTAFLDYPSKVELMQLLHQLAEERGMTILASTHDLDVAQRYGHHFWIMEKNDGIRVCEPEDEWGIEGISLSKPY